MIVPPFSNDISRPLVCDKQQVKGRSSNLELYRIICMLMIVAHHYVVNSGLNYPNGPLVTNPDTANSIFLQLFGMWGKTGINCFMMITGYFMCIIKITLKKFLKLLLQIYFYKFLLFPVFLFTGYETLSFGRVVTLLMPFWGINNDFVGCFIIFYLTIPFLSILVQNMNKRQHQLLLLLAICCYTLLGSVPGFRISFNYITWFCIIFFIASYVRLYPSAVFQRKALWGSLTLISTVLAMTSVFLLQKLFLSGYYFMEDSNKFFAVVVAVCSFLWFKNMKIKQSRIINVVGGSSFGVLLIHTNSNAMRTWLWKDTVDCVGHYSMSFGGLVMYTIGAVLVVFVVCNVIDQLRVHLVEKPFFKWYDLKIDQKMQYALNRVLNA